MKEKEMWMEKLKEKLGDYAEPTPASGWERLEKELMPPSEKRIIPYRRWVAAASVLLVLASSVSLYFLHSPAAEEIRRTSVAVLATVPDAMPVKQEPARQVAKAEPLTVVRTANVLISKAVVREAISPNEMASETVAPETEHAVASEQENRVDTETVVEQSHEKEVRKPSGRDKLHLPEVSGHSSKGRWSVGASVGNAGAISSGNAGGGQSSGGDYRLSMADAPNGIVQIPSNQVVVFKEGVPYLQSAKGITDIKHHQPISFGLSVRKELPKGFSVETGVTYTLLSSDVKLAGSSVMQDQKLHYVGIPLRANWDFVNQKLFTLYLSAGGAVEKCVYGELANEKQTVNPLQLSVMGAVGAQINATKRLGIYIEPGVAYFFNDGSDVQTIRKETPFNFNIQAGVRLTY